MASKPYWLCRCGHRNDKAHINCRGDGCNRTRPKKRGPVHEHALTEFTHEDYDRLNLEVHGVEPDECAICSRTAKPGRRLDRDHAHFDGGYPRGRLCWYCNRRLGEIERGQDGELWMNAAKTYLRRSREAWQKRQEAA